MIISTTLTEPGAPTHLKITHGQIDTIEITVVETIGAFQNAEPLLFLGHLTESESLARFLEAYNSDIA